VPYAPPNALAKGKGAKAHRRAQNRLIDLRRGSAASRGYGPRWARAAKAHLNEWPLCRYCQLKDRVTAATLVDHFYPHQGDQVLFWEQQWWVSSCKPCHDGPKQRLEAKGQDALDQVATRMGLPLLMAA
jgi:5-methylcytosine-specific restriction protein A